MIAAVYGRSRAIVSQVGRIVALVTTDRALAEARRRIELGMKRPDLLSLLDELASAITVVPLDDLADQLPASERALREASASRNGSTRDAHILALARNADADIWTTDRDFAGAGVATWSTPNLLRGLAEAVK